MPDQYRLAPYGDAVIVNTPTLDNVAKQLYAQQQQRQARQQQENQALDQMLQKDYGRIRSVDTPDVVNGYGKVKAIRKQLLFDKDLQKDPLAYNKKQQELNDAMIGLRGTINGSAEIKEANKAINSAQLKNPDAFNDDYGTMMATQMNTPLSQLRSHPVYGDLTNPDNYRYKGANTNFNEIVTKIYDKKNKIVGKEEALDNKGIQFRSPVYEYGTGPAQVYEGLTNSLDHKTERDAAYKWKQLTPDVVQKIEQDYKAIPQSKWEQMGLPGPQEIPLKGGSDAEKYMRVLAMQNAVNTNPRLVNYENRTSDKAKTDYNMNKSLILARVNHGYRDAEIKLRDELKGKDESQQNEIMDDLYDQVKKDALSSKVPYRPATGQPYDQYEMKANATIKDLFSVTDGNGHKVQPDVLRFSKDFKTVTPVFFEHSYDEKLNRTEEVVKNKKGESEVNSNLSKPILESEFKQMWMKEIMGAGAYGKTLKSGKKEKAPQINMDDLRKKYDY